MTLTRNLQDLLTIGCSMADSFSFRDVQPHVAGRFHGDEEETAVRFLAWVNLYPKDRAFTKDNIKTQFARFLLQWQRQGGLKNHAS